MIVFVLGPVTDLLYETASDTFEVSVVDAFIPASLPASVVPESSPIALVFFRDMAFTTVIWSVVPALSVVEPRSLTILLRSVVPAVSDIAFWVIAKPP